MCTCCRLCKYLGLYAAHTGACTHVHTDCFDNTRMPTRSSLIQCNQPLPLTQSGSRDHTDMHVPPNTLTHGETTHVFVYAHKVLGTPIWYEDLHVVSRIGSSGSHSNHCNRDLQKVLPHSHINMPQPVKLPFKAKNVVGHKSEEQTIVWPHELFSTIYHEYPEAFRANMSDMYCSDLTKIPQAPQHWQKRILTRERAACHTYSSECTC